MTNTPVIETNNLTKSFGNVDAVHELSMTVKAHQITGFLGLNGAGKTTTMKMLLGMIHPSRGTGQMLGKRIDNAAEHTTLLRRVAYVSENKQLYSYMTVEQIIRFTRSFYSDWRPDIERSLLKTYELPMHRKIGSLSRGMKTKLALLLAFARVPELLILDEPSEGLDPIGIEQMLESLVARSGEGTSIFFSSHQIAEVERIADHVCILHKGALALDASIDHIRQSYRQIDLVFPSAPDEAAFRMPGVTSVRTSGRQVRVLFYGDTRPLIERVNMLRVLSVETVEVGLREVFLETVRQS